jgi:predicted SnoaL-like aldol condensation-catalyzing enzyme
VPDGPEAYVRLLTVLLQQGMSTEVKGLIAGGDLVAVHHHARGSPPDRGRAVVDIYRLEDGKIVEHWDMVQEVPDGQPASDSTMF